MSDAPLALAFTAGLVAIVNPCGFAMLPAYLAWFVGISGDEADEQVDASLGRALLVGGVVSSGFLAVFGIAGVLIHAGLRVVIDVIPWLALGVGIVMIGLGVAIFMGRGPTLGFRARGVGDRNLRSVFGFGVSYAIASLSCTLPVFLSVVVGSLATTSALGGVTTFLVYGLATALMLVGLTVGVAFARHGMVRRLRSAARYVPRLSAGLLVAAGAYITWFWTINLREGPVSAGESARVVEGWSQWAIDAVADHWALVGGGLGVVVLGTALWLLLREPTDRAHEAVVESVDEPVG